MDETKSHIRYIDHPCKANVSGAVILYNSEEKVIDNIQTYIMQVDHLFIIDNSEVINDTLKNKILKVPHSTYIFNGKNEGIAFALNKAADMAIKAGYKYLLTMDDDTSMPINGVQNMLTRASQYGVDNYGIIAGQFDSRKVSDSVTLADYTITSGNLLNLSAYQDCGPFLESLFIDFVDIEYCFRLSKKNYKIVEVNSVELLHRLGTRKEISIFFNKLKKKWASHSPERVYYKVRNCIYVVRMYKDIPNHLKLHFCRDLSMEVIHIVLLEDKKITRLKLLMKAVRDALSENLGKIKYE